MPEDTTMIRFDLNGRPVEVEVPGNTLLIDLLRDGFGLTGAKVGCGVGECGACTVLLNGEPVNSCLVFVASADGGQVTTIEGLAEGQLHPLQEAFIQAGAVQCGYCTPGMILSAKALLDKNPSPSREEVALSVSGNLCRCTGYAKIIEAVSLASQMLKPNELTVEVTGTDNGQGRLRDRMGWTSSD